MRSANLCGNQPDYGQHRATVRGACDFHTGLQFHIYEFWAGFLFACIEATSLIFTPRALATVSKRPGLLRTVLCVEIKQ